MLLNVSHFPPMPPSRLPGNIPVLRAISVPDESLSNALFVPSDKERMIFSGSQEESNLSVANASVNLL